MINFAYGHTVSLQAYNTNKQVHFYSQRNIITVHLKVLYIYISLCIVTTNYKDCYTS